MVLSPFAKRVETIMDNLSPTWKRNKISVKQLCNGDYDRPLKIEIFDWDKDGSHDSMGSCQASIRQLLDPTSSFVIIEEKKKKKFGYKNSGHLSCINPVIVRYKTFLDYIKEGMQVSMMMAIDFTGSNGNPSDRRSLHYINPQMPNQYQNAILSIGNVVQEYDSDKKFPVWGYGGVPPGAGGVSHCFQLGTEPEVAGIMGILDAYNAAVSSVRLSGPTLVSCNKFSILPID